MKTHLLDSAQSQLTNLGVTRARFEHAIAVLTGQSPAAVGIGATLRILAT